MATQDNKVNMSLDDIIKMNKKQEKTTGRRKVVMQGGRGAIRGRRSIGGRGGIGARAIGRRPVGQAGPSRPAPASGNINGGAKKVLQNMVKKAVKKALQGNVAAGAQARRGGIVRRGGVTRQAAVIRQGGVVRRVGGAGVLNRLSGVAQRSRVIARPARQQQIVQRVIQQRPKVFRRNVQAPTQVVERIIERPVVKAQPRQRLIVQRVVEQPQRFIQQPRQQRPAQRQKVIVQRVQQVQQRRPQQQRTIVVERSIPRVQQQVIRRPVQVVKKVFQRPAIQQRVQYVEVPARKQQVVRRQQVQTVYASPSGRGRQNRGGRGFSQRGNRAGQQRVVEVSRFEPFNTGRSVQRKGRGFQDYEY